MTYVKLTLEGKNFIRKACGTGTSKIKGKNKFGVLPYCSPATSPDKIWESKAMYNGKLITNNEQLAEALIDWYDKYGLQYQMDANVLAAQAFQESEYVVWNYSTISDASGISQFIGTTVFDVVLNGSKFTSDEKAAIIKGLSGNMGSADTFRTSELIYRQNRPILHQNITDNPEIMIKAQYVYMKRIADKYSPLTSNVLFGYNRGPSYIRPAYSDSIAAATNGKGREVEGVDYVYQIFNFLGNKNYSRMRGYYFGYDFLGMNNTFNNFQADIDESKNRGHA